MRWFIAIWLVLLTMWTASHARSMPDRLVSLLEARQGVSPGATRVLPDCGCTIRYVGTYVHGRRYTVVIDRLD